MESFNDGSMRAKHLFSKLEEYMAEIDVKPIAMGSSRIAYRLNKDYVIKLAMNNIGVSQNLNEAYYFKLNNSVFNRNLSCSKKGYWVIAEYAEPVTTEKIRKIFGCSKGQLENMIGHVVGNCKFQNKTVKDLYNRKYRNRKFFKDLRKLPQMGLIPDDYAGFWGGNYGISKKGLVLLDGGLTAETAQLYY